MTDEGRANVSAAVATVERQTAGEVVTIVTQQSDDYAEIALLWSAFVAFLALAVLTLFPDFYLGLYDRLTGGWVQEWHPRSVFAVALLVAVLKFAGMWLLQLWRPLRLFLVPGPVKHARVRARAITCFRVGAERRTHGRTGILIYLSMAERRAEIVADEAIAGKVAPEVWGEAMAAMLAHLREGRVADGMVAAIAKVGEVLAGQFPLVDGDTNELPDRLIEV
ncbi:MAG: TPM domain-containing protein [Novosphingobium sp.]